MLDLQALMDTLLISGLVVVTVYSVVTSVRLKECMEDHNLLVACNNSVLIENGELQHKVAELEQALDAYFKLEADRFSDLKGLPPASLSAYTNGPDDAMVLIRTARVPEVRYALSREAAFYDTNPFGRGDTAVAFCKYLSDQFAKEYAKVLLPQLVTFVESINHDRK